MTDTERVAQVTGTSQAPAASFEQGPGRADQRRRTRKAIVEATSQLILAGVEPSIADIAQAADVSRRTVYMYFPTLDQLLIDATIGAMDGGIEAFLERLTETDARVRLTALIDALFDRIETSLPLGRKLIKLTVDVPRADGVPVRGYRRIRWLEQALEPERERLGPERFERLVSMVALAVGWEAFIVLYDIRGLTTEQARDTSRAAAMAILDAAL
jgi:AcrR family transcriptional regulator